MIIGKPAPPRIAGTIHKDAPLTTSGVNGEAPFDYGDDEWSRSRSDSIHHHQHYSDQELYVCVRVCMYACLSVCVSVCLSGIRHVCAVRS